MTLTRKPAIGVPRDSSLRSVQAAISAARQRIEAIERELSSTQGNVLSPAARAAATADLSALIARVTALEEGEVDEGTTTTTGSGDVVESVAAEDLEEGQPVYADPVTGQFKLANATALAKASVVGLTAATIASGFVAQAERLSITLADWSPVIGSASLTKGQIYFLGTTAGTLTTTAPTTVGHSVTRIGIAITTKLMQLAIQPPVLL